MVSDAAQFVPRRASVDRAHRAHAHGLQGALYLAACHRGIIGVQHHQVLAIERRDVREQHAVVGFDGFGKNALDIEQHHQAAVLQLGDGGHQAPHGVAEHFRRHAHLRPIHPQDGVHRLDQKALGMVVVFGDDHDLALRIGGHRHVVTQIHHRHQRAAQADHALDRRVHLRRRRDGRRVHHLAHLEHVDAEGLATPRAGIRSQREQQDFELVGPGQAGSCVNTLQ